jgi:hypothetical protein
MNTETLAAQTLALLNEEQVEPITRLAKVLPPIRGARRDANTLRRWIRQGKRGRAGEVIYLEGFYGPDRAWWSSRPALARFFARLQGQLAPQQPVPSNFERLAAQQLEEFQKELKKGQKKKSGRRAYG